ncbi:MAG TPA: dipeptidase [Pyrinomonadaceae bacterium]
MKSRRVAEYIKANSRRFVSELKEFIRFASVSAQPQHAADVRRCAEWLAAHLRRVGLTGARVYETPRHPVVYAEWRGAPGRPTVLVYGHYDVQPADPVGEWKTPPFEPEVRGSYIYGRSACDDKGQLFTHVKAIEAYMRAAGALPVNVKCLFEGEEEIGSPNLKDFVRRHARALAADVAVMSDTRMLSPERPAITYSLRGGLSLELEVFGPRRDLHSGNFGGAVHNPLQGLCEIVAGLHDARGRVAVEGFYDRVREWGRDERAYMARTGPSDAKILRDAGAEVGWGERGYTLYERTTIRPALTVNGIGGGYQGTGGKSVIPARAFAKLNVRLVPAQDPREIEQLLRRHVERHTPPALRSRLTASLYARPALLDPRHPVMRAAREAYRVGFGSRPVFLRSGGTIPVVNTFQEVLGTPTVLMGFALPDDRMHAPDEKFHLPNFFRGIETSLTFLREVARGDWRREATAPYLCAPACKCEALLQQPYNPPSS